MGLVEILLLTIHLTVLASGLVSGLAAMWWFDAIVSGSRKSPPPSDTESPPPE